MSDDEDGSNGLSTIELAFAEMEREAETAFPGLNDLFTVYGTYADSLAKADAYLNSAQPRMKFAATGLST